MGVNDVINHDKPGDFRAPPGPQVLGPCDWPMNPMTEGGIATKRCAAGGRSETARAAGLGYLGWGWSSITHRIHGAGIYANIGGILMVNVTIYSSTMDPMGNKKHPKRIEEIEH